MTLKCVLCKDGYADDIDYFKVHLGAYHHIDYFDEKIKPMLRFFYKEIVNIEK